MKLQEIDNTLLTLIKSLKKPTMWAYKNQIKQQNEGINRQKPHQKWEEILGIRDIDWRYSFTNIFQVTKNTKLQAFQYKLLHRCTITNSKLFYFGIKPTKACTFCSLYSETIVHLFWDCLVVKSLWLEVAEWYKDITNVSINMNSELIILNGSACKTVNSLIIEAKYYIYICRCKEISPDLNGFLRYLRKEINIECLAEESAVQKWAPILDNI